jgi:hypothetical protein
LRTCYSSGRRTCSVQETFKFEIGISQSLRLEDETADVIDVEEGPELERSSQLPIETEEAGTAGNVEGGVGSSESYLRQALKARYVTQTVKTTQRYRGVILRYPTTSAPVRVLPSI